MSIVGLSKERDSQVACLIYPNVSGKVQACYDGYDVGNGLDSLAHEKCILSGHTRLLF